MEIEVGKFYLTRSGKKVLIERRMKRTNRYAFIGNNGERYMHDGKWSPYSESDKDLILIID